MEEHSRKIRTMKCLVSIKSMYPTVSCLGVTGITPAWLVRPTVGLMPTTELKLAGHNMEPSVSVPRDTATKFAAAEIAGPLLDPQGVADST